MSGNTTVQPAKTPPQRPATAGSWQPGKSGNPSGRPRGFAGVARMILEATRDGAELVEFAINVLRDPSARLTERLAAHAWLSDRALGKPLATVDVTAGPRDSAVDRRRVLGVVPSELLDQVVETIERAEPELLEAAAREANEIRGDE